MKTNTTYLTILFLLLVLNSCVSSLKLPSTALCTKDAKTMEENYIVSKRFDIDPEHDNRVISFTYNQMIESLAYLKAQAELQGIEGKELGLRVYLGAKYIEDYNQKKDSIKGDMKSIKEEPGTYYTTVFFVATKKGATEDENDYENVYEIPALNYGGSRRPPKLYDSNLKCPVHNKIH